MSKHGLFGIRRWRDDKSGREGLSFWCPGCKSAHSIGLSGPGPNWSFNGDYDKPVLSPSILVSIGGEGTRDPDTGLPYPRETLCHSFVGCNGAQPGQIVYLGDSGAHELRGAHDLEPWPRDYGFGSEGDDQ
jgi:hypothetical protein